MRLTAYIQKADHVFRVYMKRLWGAPYRIECVLCKHEFEPEQIEIGHVIPRSNYIVRWKVINALPLCRKCNQNDGDTETLKGHVSEENFALLTSLSGDTTFRLTQDFIEMETAAYVG